MNDIILSALLNLFALFGALTGADKAKSAKIISNYLNRHFGIRNLDEYLNLYNDLRGFYDDFPDFNKSDIINGICSNIQHKILQEEQALLLLRFMEFSAISSDKKESLEIAEMLDSQEDIFNEVAKSFNVSQELQKDFYNYVTEKETDKIKIIKHPNLNGHLRILNVTDFNKIIFSYIGKDEVFMEDIPILPGLFLIWQRSGVLKGKNFKPLYYSNIKAKYEDLSQKNYIELAGREVEFRFPNSNNGMHNLSFTLNSGQLVAIMGGSGVGKSTLLSLLNGSLKPQSGSITLNGIDISNEEVQNHIGFVPQDDLLIEELTVYENLWFTAKLCFDKLPEEEIDRRVINTLTDLGLDAAKDLKVGSAINKFISGGQRKRLNIALELIREPSVLYLDEPTSGLSSTDSEKVINLLKEQTFKGKLIVVNIHQPSSDIFKLFDKLWLLDKGGYPIYDGNPIEAVTYFKNAAEYADSNISTCSTCGNVNPEIVLNIIDEKSLNDSGQLTEKRKVSPEQWHNKYVENRGEQKELKTFDIPKTNQKKPNALKQLGIYLHRNLKTKITNTQYLLISLLQAPLLAVIVAFLTKYTPEEGYTIADNKNLVSYFFMAIIVAIFIGMSASAEEIFKDKALLKREKFLRLSRNSYIWSKIIFMGVLSLIQTFTFILVGNSIMGIQGQWLSWWLILFVSAFLANLTGLVLSQTLSSIVAIYITIPLLLIPQILLCGLVVKFEDLNPNSKTGNVPIVGDIIPSRWAFEALAVNSFTSNAYEKPIFNSEKNRFEAQYYRSVFLYELESQLETANDEFQKEENIQKSHFDILKNEIPRLAKVCDIDIYPDLEELSEHNYSEEIYNSLNKYFKKADKILSKRMTYFNRETDKYITRQIKEIGKESFLRLKKNNYNLFLEDLVLNSSTEKTHKIVHNTIIPKAGYIYLSPWSNNGRAPFYSSSKVIMGTEVPTYWYNIGILILMSILTAIALFLDFPGRIINKQNN